MLEQITIVSPWPKDMISAVCITCSQAALLPNGLYTCLATATPTQQPCLSLTLGTPKVLSYHDLIEMNTNSTKIKVKESKKAEVQKPVEKVVEKIVEQPIIQIAEKPKPKAKQQAVNSQIGMF